MTNVRVIVSVALGVLLLGGLVCLAWPHGGPTDAKLEKMIQALDENAKQLNEVLDLLDDVPVSAARKQQLTRFLKVQKDTTIEAEKRRKALGDAVSAAQAARLDEAHDRSIAAMKRFKERFGEARPKGD